MICEACMRGDHGNCGLQHWCECDDPRDGDEMAIPDWNEDMVEDEDDGIS
jgi:hypothetical protein